MNIKIELNKNPKPKPPLDNLGFGNNFSDHMSYLTIPPKKGGMMHA